MALGIYAGTSASGVTLLPSPVEIKPSLEIIWSENTGRAQSGTNKAKMIGDVVAQKKTYEIKWGILTATEFSQVTSKLTAGFFYFACAMSLSDAINQATTYYRSNIAYEMISIGGDVYYKDASVSVIQQ